MKRFNPQIQHFLVSFLKELEEMQMPYVIMRDYENLPYSVNNDIDLLFPWAFRHRSIAVLRSTATRYSLRVALRYSANCTSFFLFLDGFLEGIHVDLFYSLDFRGIPLVSSSLMLSRRKPHKIFFILDKSDEAYLNFIYRFLIRGEIRTKYRKAFSQCAQDESIFQMNLMETFGNKSGEQISKWLAEENFHTLTHNHFKLFAIFFLTQIRHQPLQTASGLLFTFRRLLRRVCYPEGAQGLLYFDSREVEMQEVPKLLEALEQILYKSKISILKKPTLLNGIRAYYKRFMGHLVIFLSDAPPRHTKNFNFRCRIQASADGMSWKAVNRANQGADATSLAIFILQSIASCEKSDR